MQLDPISTVAASVETRLRTWFPKEKWDFFHVPAALSLEEFRRHVRRLPMFALAFRSLIPADNCGRKFKGIITFSLTLVVRNQNAATGARFFGDRLGPGLFPTLSSAIAALHGWTVRDLGTFSVGNISQTFAEGWNDLDTALATFEIKALISFDDVLGEVGKAPEFLSLLTHWDLQTEEEPIDTIEPRKG